MPGRKSKRVYVKAGPFEAGFEWVGFRDAGTFANLDTTVGFEILPPVPDSTVGSSQFTVYRIVGQLAVMHQTGIVSSDRMGIVLVAAEVGDDQTVDEPVDPISTDIDEFADKTIMWWWSGSPTWGVPIADSDVTPWHIPIDIKVRRIIKKRTRLVFNATAATTARLRMTCNVRVLIRHRNA